MVRVTRIRLKRHKKRRLSFLNFDTSRNLVSRKKTYWSRKNSHSLCDKHASFHKSHSKKSLTLYIECVEHEFMINCTLNCGNKRTLNGHAIQSVSILCDLETGLWNNGTTYICLNPGKSSNIVNLCTQTVPIVTDSSFSVPF